MANWIDPRQNEPWFVPYGPPVAKKNPASRDLVVCQHYAIDNRWRQTNDLVNYDDVERPSTRRLESKNWHIRRLKMCNLPRNESTYLLLNLEQSDLVVLEIDRLELLQKNLGDEVTTFRFPNLEILSIGKIVTVDEYDNRLPEVQTPVLFKALVLKEVDLGAKLLDYVSFNVDFSVTILEIGRNSGAYLPNYKNVKEIRWNQIEERNIPIIYQLVEGSICPKLVRLLLNLSKLRSTSYEPNEHELNLFRRLYGELQGRMRPGGARAEPAVTVYFNYVKIDFRRDFDEYRFGQRLAAVHRDNAMDGLSVLECRTVYCAEYTNLPNVLFEPDNLANERHFGLFFFSYLYPNIREVVLDYSLSRRTGVCSEDRFVHFLKTCKALVSLRLQHTGFSDDLYNRLATGEVASLHTLNTFLLVEPKLTQQFINEHFLDSLPYLRHIRTNLATKKVMLELVERAPIGAGYEFEFSQEGLGDLYVVAIIRKENTESLPLYNLRVGRRRARETNLVTIYNKNHDPYELKNYFDCISNKVVSSHWLRDNVDDRPGSPGHVYVV